MTVLFVLTTTGRMAWAARIREDRLDSLTMTMVVVLLLGLVLVMIVTWRRRTELRRNAITLGKGWLALRPASETGLLPSHADARLTVPYASVTAIESRSVRHWFHANRVFRLLRRDGPPLFLFEDRGMDTYWEPPSLTPVAAAIALQAGVPFEEHAPPAPASRPVGWRGLSLEEQTLDFETLLLAVFLMLSLAIDGLISLLL